MRSHQRSYDCGAILTLSSQHWLHHADAAALFEPWSSGWTGVGFAAWDIRPSLSAIAVPVVVAQSDGDEFRDGRDVVVDRDGDRSERQGRPPLRLPPHGSP